jgi:hypothetical protein
MATSYTITTRYSSDKPSDASEHTTYVQDDRSRDEFDGRHAVIRRCDLGRIFSLDLTAREYESTRLVAFNSRPLWFWKLRFFVTHPILALRADKTRPPTVLVETTTVDTGERKDVFGFTARRVVMTRTHRPLTPTSEPSENTTDGWYIDVDLRVACERSPGHTEAFLSAGGEVPQFKSIGPHETGLPVDVTHVHSSRMALPDGTQRLFTSTSRRQVIRLSTDPIDPRVFEIPAGFRRKPRFRRRTYFPSAG